MDPSVHYTFSSGFVASGTTSNGLGSGLKMDSGADCWFFSRFLGVPGGSIDDSNGLWSGL